jgi:MPBQ/MSBQ methyltransferase
MTNEKVACSEDDVRKYLLANYEGIFESDAIESHLRNHVGFEFAKYTTEVITLRLPLGSRVLDVGSGFGSVVVSARNAGMDAFGIEIAAFEVDYARQRLQELRPEDDPEKVFLLGDACTIQLEPESLDAVTCWNVLEHIEDWTPLLRAATKYLKPGGHIFIVCPNYMAWRMEAHYHVPWKPSFLRSRSKAAAYLRMLGRNSAFFENSIFYRTNYEVLGKLKEFGFESLELGTGESRSLRPRNWLQMLCHPVRFARFYSPWKHSVEVAGRKMEGKVL